MTNATHYNGLASDFRKASLNLCNNSLDDEVWAAWQGIQFSDGGETYTFPVGNTENDKKARLEFLDHYLFTLLTPKDRAAPNRRQLPKIRGDLNKYRGWLANRILQQMLIQQKNPSQQNTYRLPEDSPKLVDDLFLFHKHITGSDKNIAQYPSLDALAEKVEPYQIPHPLLAADRAIAHARFLETDTPEKLEEHLLPGWVATETMVQAADGTTYPREGGAKCIAVLADGTEIIQLLSEKASVEGYGSPRWCTAYREKGTCFADYKDDLLVVLNPDGTRHQLHMRTNQFMDANDRPVDLGNLLQDNPGLDKVIAPAYFANPTKGLYPVFRNLSQYSPMIVNPDPLFVIAAGLGDSENFFALLEREDVDIYARNDQGRSALIAALRGGHTNITELLLNRFSQINEPAVGEYINLVDAEGYTALLEAAKANQITAIKALLRLGADVNLTVGHDTPLIAAAMYGHMDVVKYFLENGANVNLTAGHYTPLIAAAVRGHMDVVKYFLEYGVDVNLTGTEGHTPLIAAAMAGEVEIIRLLLEHRAEINSVDNCGNTALATAAKYGHTESVQLLLEHHAEINLVDDYGNTALATAAEYGNTETVRFLLASGANPRIRQEDLFARIKANKRDRTEIIQLLQNYEAQQNGATAQRPIDLIVHETSPFPSSTP